MDQPNGFITYIERILSFPVRHILYTNTRPAARSGTDFAQRLRHALPIWEHLFHAPPDILHGIKHGFPLPWNCAREDIPRIPPRIGHYTYDQLVLGNTIIDRFVSLDVLGIRLSPGRINLFPFFIPKEGTDNQFRFLVNGSPISPYLRDLPFHLDQLDGFLRLCKDGDRMFHLDMVDAYHLVGVAEIDFECLVFAFPTLDGNIRYLFFKRLPQGIKCSGAIFNSVFSIPDSFYRRERGLPQISYLDDKGAVTGRADATLAEVNFNIAFFCGLYVLAGGLLSWNKTRAYARTTDKLLGHVIFTSPRRAIQVASKRWNKMLVLVKSLLDTPTPSFRLAGKFGGSGQSCSLPVPEARLHLRYTYNFTAQALLLGWDSTSASSIQLREEWEWWLTILSAPPVLHLLNYDIPRFAPIKWQGNTDASAEGLGGFIQNFNFVTEQDYDYVIRMQQLERGKYGWPAVPKGREHLAGVQLCTARNLLPDQYDESSTLRELRAILHLIQTFREPLCGVAFRLFVDNAAVVRILKFGSNKLDCHSVALCISAGLTSNDTSLYPLWIPRHLNTRADFLSRQIDYADYFLARESFLRICTMFRVRPVVDLFATSDNKQPDCSSFVSKFFQPNCCEVDAFSFDWSTRFPCSYGFPPVDDIVKVLLHLQHMNTSPLVAILVVPLWAKHRSIPLLCPDGNHFRPEIKAFALLERGLDISCGPVGRPDFLSPPYQGHRHSFAAILWDTRIPNLTVPQPLARSTFPVRFCLARHYGKVCSSCQPAALA